MQPLGRRLREMEERRVSHLEQVFLDWRELPEDRRPEFLSYARHRRHPEIAGGDG